MRGVDPEFETNTAMPPQFLIEQMGWRERIEARVRKSRSPASG